MSDSFDKQALLALLLQGEMESLGLLPWGSNYTFLAKISPKGGKAAEDEGLLVVYKPRRGEAPLWDFPDGTLCLREYAAFLVSDVLQWNIVPPTVLRTGTHGFGSVQLFIENDSDQHFFTFRSDPSVCEQLMKVAAFDLITTNADRKSGHCLIDKSGRVWAIDHGICFNCDYKLRTVIWDYAGQPIPNDMVADLRRLLVELDPARALGKALRHLLDDGEVESLHKRTEGLLKIGKFPSPGRYERSVPWPPV
jgi:uncharacterized repeat protein (TIGR03843 family)